MSKKNMSVNWEKWYPESIKKDMFFKEKISHDNIKLYQKYYDKGFKLGLKEGYKLKLKKTEFNFYLEKNKLQNKMKNCLDSLNSSFKNLDTIIVNQLLQIVLKVSSNILNYPVYVQKTEIIKKIKTMLSKTILSKKVTFTINKDDITVFKNYFQKILSSYDYLIYCDSSIKSGECIIGLEDQIIDSTSHTKWKELCRLFCDRQLL